MIVSEPPRSILEIRLELENGVALFLVALACHFHQVLNKVLPVPSDKVGDNLFVQVRIKIRVTGDVPAIEKGDIEFQVVPVKAAAFVKGAGGIPDPQPQIPERPGNHCNLFPDRLFDTAISGEEKEVNVRMGKEFSPAIAAQSHESEIGGAQKAGVDCLSIKG
jgi:hypothetical protein